MAMLVSVVLGVRKGSAYWVWNIVRSAMDERLLQEQEVKKALSALIELGMSRVSHLERGSNASDPAGQLWQDVFHFIREGALSPFEVKANLYHLRQLGFYAPIPERVRKQWPPIRLVARNSGGSIDHEPGNVQ
jgi:hypothetical protein